MTQTRRRFMGTAAATTLLSACATPLAARSGNPDIEIFDSAAEGLLRPSERIESLSSGFTWSEGPVWDRKRNCLYFSDVPGNIVWKWTEAEGAIEFLNPSGIAGTNATGFREPGANGLAISQDGHMLICNHGRRAIEKMNIDTGQRVLLAGEFDGKPFNSPNDVVEGPDGSLYFTDPPYGLDGLDESPLKQQDANGVYRLSPDGTVSRLIDTMTFPNGAALSTDGQTLYVSQSDPERPVILRMATDGSAQSVLFDASRFMTDAAPGLPDGMAVAASGHILATGPGGVFLLAPNGRPLARINTGKATANCCFGGADGQTLYMTAHDTLMRIRTKMRGLAWS